MAASIRETEDRRASIGARRNPETEAAVLDAAEALLAEVGYGSLTMEAVARRARAGKATLYRWWPSKGHLLLALYSRAKMELPQPDTGSLRADLIAYVGPLLASWQGESGPALAPMLRLLIAEAQVDPTVMAALREERRIRWHHIDRIIVKAILRGELNRDLAPERAEQRVISLLWYLLLTDQLPMAAEAEALVDTLLAGMLREDRADDPRDVDQ